MTVLSPRLAARRENKSHLLRAAEILPGLAELLEDKSTQPFPSQAHLVLGSAFFSKNLSAANRRLSGAP